MVQVDQSLEDFFVFQVMWPAVSVEDSSVEVVVDLLEHRHEPLFVYRLLFGVKQRKNRLQRMTFFSSSECLRSFIKKESALGSVWTKKPLSIEMNEVRG